jgi:basic membrane protein A
MNKFVLQYDVGGKFDKSFNEAAYNGAEKFKTETGTPIANSKSPTTPSASRRSAAWRDGNNPIPSWPAFSRAAR